MIEIIKEIILDFQNDKRDMGIKRDIICQPVKNKAFICIGVRRCGKSTLLYQIIEKLLDTGISKENILYLNFFDDRLNDLKHGNFQLILDAYFSIYPEKKGTEKIYCFFDEIQETNGWEAFIDRLMRQEKCEVYITGSSAKMLSKEIATQMRGRAVSAELFPFSFMEYLKTKKGLAIVGTTKYRYQMQKYFNEYLEVGGFPETLGIDKKLRRVIHQEYYKTIVHRDIIERYDAGHPQAVMQAAYKLLGAVSNLYSINRITDYLKSMQFKISKEFTANMIDWFEDAYFLFSIKKYDKSIARQNVNPKKVYCIDHSLVNSVCPLFQNNYGYILENIVFLHLRRQFENICYYRTASGAEVDFIWTNENGKQRIAQVCYNMNEEKTRGREITALTEAMSELKLSESIIITENEDEIIERNGKSIIVLPAWKVMVNGKW